MFNFFIFLMVVMMVVMAVRMLAFHCTFGRMAVFFACFKLDGGMRQAAFLKFLAKRAFHFLRVFIGYYVHGNKVLLAIQRPGVNVVDIPHSGDGENFFLDIFHADALGDFFKEKIKAV